MKKLTIKGQWGSEEILISIHSVKFRMDSGMSAAREGKRAKGIKSSADHGRNYIRLKHAYKTWMKKGVYVELENDTCGALRELSQWYAQEHDFLKASPF